MAGYTRAVFALVCAVMAATFFPAGARAEIITIVMNQAKIIKLPKPADTIVIGNSEIADATVQDDDTIVLTGKGFGQTNLVVFDDDGEVIMDSQLAVARQMDNSVRVYRPGNIQTLYCSPFCEGSFRTSAEQESDSVMAR
ncbi:pilus assembly protein N-terminal domain-containing protein [Chelativorans composti]|jgi:Flp pilus assembly protein, secretin CpaC|uniref:Pilus assembly protein N-terminal domain-containing protein n=1 Tax=Chelativorans composti TaxID=768533 RepID=A0ABW5DKR5_9HYPH